MPKKIEEKIMKCSTCNKKTIHMRNSQQTGLLMFLVHLVLTVATVGVWLVLVIVWTLLNKQIGGWQCRDCGG